MSKPKKKFSAKQLRIIRFAGVLFFVGTCIVAFISTGNDRFLKRCLANGNSVKYCNDIYDNRNLAFKDKKLEKEENTRQRELVKEEKRKQKQLIKEEKRKQRELELAEQRIKELELAEKRRKELRKLIVKTEYYDNGRYTGQWLDDQRHGEGTYFYSDGDKYIGQWKNGDKEGQGTYIWSDGDRFVGQWRNNKKYGQGTFIYANGRTEKQYW